MFHNWPPPRNLKYDDPPLTLLPVRYEVPKNTMSPDFSTGTSQTRGGSKVTVETTKPRTRTIPSEAPPDESGDEDGEVSKSGRSNNKPSDEGSRISPSFVKKSSSPAPASGGIGRLFGWS